MEELASRGGGALQDGGRAEGHGGRRRCAQVAGGGAAGTGQETRAAKAILERTVELLGKGQGVDPGMLTNREKTLIANSLRPARRLNEILAELGMSRGSYQYQVEAMSGPDKYAGLGKRVSEIFAASDSRYGYRRIRLDLGTRA